MDMDELGEPLPSLVVKLPMRAIIEKGIIKGRVMYIDSYENVYLNITEKEFREAVGSKPFTINFRRSDFNIDRIVKAYGDVSEAEMCALFSSTGYLEIAMNKGKASSLLGLYMDTPVNVIIGD